MNDWSVLDVLPLGIVMVNRTFNVVRWNRWMEVYSGLSAQDVEGTSLFHHYPDLNRPSFLRSCRTVFTFGNVVYLSQKLHHYLFPFPLHAGQIGDAGGDMEMMQQSCSMTPVRNDEDEVELVAITVQDVTDSVLLERRLRLLNRVDALTGAYNRRFLDQRLEEEVDRHRRYDRSLSVAIMDLDHFKEINDEWGHPEGDRVLRALSAVAQEVIRSSDFFCRYGGEEFVALLPETSGCEAAELAERIRHRVMDTEFESGGRQYRVTASFGTATLGGDIGDAGELLAAADARLYRAKQAGRNRVVSGPA